MKAVIITIGDEILYGQTVDTNSAWMASELGLLGISIHEIVSISDEKDHILKTLKKAHQDADIVLMTGGLGPTNDDITKQTLTEYFGVELKRDDQIYEDVQKLFNRKGLALLENNKRQANVPENCQPIRNKNGTAPGMFFHENGKVTVSMPGVPYEMKPMVTEFVIPELYEIYDFPKIQHRFVMTAGMGESRISEMLEDFEKELPENVRLAYLPSLAEVKLRLTARGEDEQALEKQLDEQEQKIRDILPDIIYGTGRDNSISKAVGEMLKKRKATMATAESCTGGNIASQITSVAGSSAYFEGSIVSYTNKMKMEQLGVMEKTLKDHGAVSEETVEEMVSGLIKNLGVDYGIAVSGIAGPSGGTEEKPVGTVWLAVGSRNEMKTKKLQLKGARLQIIQRTTTIALNELRKFIKAEASEQ